MPGSVGPTHPLPLFQVIAPEYDVPIDAKWCDPRENACDTPWCAGSGGRSFACGSSVATSSSRSASGGHTASTVRWSAGFAAPTGVYGIVSPMQVLYMQHAGPSGALYVWSP